MTINTIKITQLVPIGSGLDANSTLPIVDLNGNAVTRKTSAANLANLILSNAGGVFSPASEALTAQSVTNAAQPNITSVGTLSFLSVTGNVSIGGAVSASQFIGDITGNVSNANYANFAGEVTSSSQPNITSLGTLTELNIAGNIDALYANIAYFATANYFIGDGGFLTNVKSQTANTVINNAQPNITSVGTLTTLTVSGNVTTGNIQAGNLVKANYFVGDGGLLSNISVNAVAVQQIVNGTSDFRISTPNGNITANVNGVPNVAIFSQNGLDIAGYISATGNITGDYISGNGSLLTSLTGANVTGQVPNALIASSVVGLTKLPFDYTSTSPFNIVQVSSGSTIAEVTLIITTPFDGMNPTLSIGDGTDANRLLATTDCLANEIGTYTVSPAYKYASTTQLILTINSGASTAGEGLIIINYE